MSGSPSGSPSGSRRGLTFVVAAPSGTGKTTVCRRVVDADDGIAFSVSHTTRPRRPAERDGVDYHFVTKDAFGRMVEEDAFLEHAEYNSNQYGTSWRSLEAPLAEGRDVLLEIEVQGARQVRQRLPEARLVFLVPPSMKTLEDRLRGRGTDSDAQIARRLAVAEREIPAVREFDYAVPNDELDRCIADVLEIVRAERAGEAAPLRRRFDPAAAWDRLASTDAGPADRGNRPPIG